MKILFINLPYYGHVVPTIGLVQEIIKLGCYVTYLMPYDWEDMIRDSGASFHGYHNHKQLSEQIKNAYSVADHIADDFDMIIYEQFFFLGKHLADKHNKPAVRIFSAPVANKKLMDEYISSKGPLHIFKHKWINKAFTKDIAKGIPLKTDNWLDEIIYNPPELNLVYTLREYQPYQEEFLDEHFKFLGPSIYNRNNEIIDFIKGERPVIYISLGTVVKGAKSFFQNCIEAFRNENVDVIISAGRHFDISKLKNIPSHIHLYNFVPQVDVLKVTDVFVTHGGMNSVSESLVSCTPMVVIPFTSDQPVNARCVERLGVGKQIDYSHVTPESLRHSVLSVLHNHDITNNINHIKGLIDNAPGNSGGAKMIIDYYNRHKLFNDM